jgi:hypothetical protein
MGDAAKADDGLCSKISGQSLACRALKSTGVSLEKERS